jgi:LDH2 family malate/lactate/ureidoglycolate dehydrogenase
VRTLSPPALEELVTRVLEAAGAPPAAAAQVAGSLIVANLLGVDSHGVVRVTQYVQEIGARDLDPRARPSVDGRGLFLVVDGRGGFGQLAAAEAATRLVPHAQEAGLAAATVSGVRHVGRLGEYVELLARAGLLALALCNSGGPGGRVAPFGGSRPFFSTNPIAYALPSTSEPVVADFSTSVVAEGRVRLARQRGERLPEAWLLDAKGSPTTDPSALYEGGSLLPAGGHKGSALALLAEVAGGVLAGAGTASTGADPGNGLVLLALDPARLRPTEAFAAAVERVAGELRLVPPAAGVDRVRAPGDLERETRAHREAHGIPVAEETWRELVSTAKSLGADVL